MGANNAVCFTNGKQGILCACHPNQRLIIDFIQTNLGCRIQRRSGNKAGNNLLNCMKIHMFPSTLSQIMDNFKLIPAKPFNSKKKKPEPSLRSGLAAIT
jgi:hypothetical protein